jgi:hypothetical protein
MAGRRGRWIVRLSDTAREGGLEGMRRRFDGLSVREGRSGALLVTDPDYGEIIFEEDGIVRAEGRILRPSDWSIRGDATYLDIPERGARRTAS